jgi:hypothetical protein
MGFVPNLGARGTPPRCPAPAFAVGPLVPSPNMPNRRAAAVLRLRPPPPCLPAEREWECRHKCSTLPFPLGLFLAFAQVPLVILYLRLN